MSVVMLVHEVAEEFGLTPDAIRQMERAGKIRCARTPSGVRIFDPAEVERVQRERERRAKSREGDRQ